MTKLPGDGAVAEWFAAHGKALLLYARQWVDGGEAEDVVQQVFMRLLAGGAVPGQPRTWLFRCVRNEAIGVWRSNQRRRKREREVASEKVDWFVASPEDRLDAAMVQAALRALPLEQREVVTLRLWSGLTLAEAAAVMDVAVSTVHAWYAEAMPALRKILETSCKNQNR
jgi:RNA polymerase sigma-70 factor (ECF subfamily)